MLHNHTHKIVHSSAMYYQNLIIIHECSKKLLKMKNSNSYFCGINFSRLAAQKHIRGLLNSRWADAHLSFLYCTINIIQWMIHIYKYLCNWAAQKQADLRQTWVYYPFASTHMVNTQLLRVQNVHTKYFRGFLNSRLLKNREIREKLMYREYFRVYGILACFYSGYLESQGCASLIWWSSCTWNN